jgi:hypothetical protein
MKKNNKLILLCLILSIVLSSCGSLFLPRKQKVTFKTNSDSATVYLDYKKIGKAEEITKKVKKEGPLQVIVREPGHKLGYYCLMPNGRPFAFYPLYLLSFPTIYGPYLDGNTNNTFKYPKIFDLTTTQKIYIEMKQKNTFN